jgi:hypothetical protein
MNSSSYAKTIKERILNSKAGSIFVTADFADIVENTRIIVILSRLEKEGIIRRIMRGVYYSAEYSNFLQEYLAPSPDLVAQAIARNFGWTIVPCGDTALNMLGLSTQVPAVWLYVSDGTYKKYTFNKTTIKFKRTTNKEISKLSYKTALVIQALKALGKNNVTDAIIVKLKKGLTTAEKDKILEEAKTATSWVYEYLKIICRSD